ncbi:hypothetical protein HPB47_006718 [Ixodes persulcatus]|uniref:Uncharacterized protein n=1 Tax=Ixodes persulcatus TaxID=34615 RepID=A0AC60PA17_IXOPE|nr:hypothetical protein HPB47_006718 [Ixodes persulcatus]
MNTFGLPSLAPFLEAPGDPAVPWRQWREDFEIFLQATKMDAKPPAQRKAILLQCLGVEGRRSLLLHHQPLLLQLRARRRRPHQKEVSRTTTPMHFGCWNDISASLCV